MPASQPLRGAVFDVDTACTIRAARRADAGSRRQLPLDAEAGTIRTLTDAPGGGKGRSVTRPTSASGMWRCRFARERCGPIENAPAFGQPAMVGPTNVGEAE